MKPASHHRHAVTGTRHPSHPEHVETHDRVMAEHHRAREQQKGREERVGHCYRYDSDARNPMPHEGSHAQKRGGDE
jgi:hypothetical protein